MTDPSMIAHYKRLVQGRSDIQELCFRLYALVKDQRALLEQDAARRSIFNLLVGASFSLWRAIFLTASMERDPSGLMDHVEDFLTRLVRDNAITYESDRQTQKWSAGYYINNARYRLARVKGKLAQISGTDPVALSAAFQKFDALDQQGLDSKSTLMDEWNNTYETLRDALALLFVRQ